MMRAVVMGLLLALLLAGCAGTPFPPEPRVPVSLVAPAQLAAADWPAPGRYTLRYTAELKLLWRTVPLTLLLQLDTDRPQLRLAGLDGQLGMTLFTLEADGDTVTLQQVAPPLARHEALLRRIGRSLLRMHAGAAPERLVTLQQEAQELTLVRVLGATTRTSVYGGAPLRRLARSGEGPDESWQVEYFRFVTTEHPPRPTGMVLRDHRGGYRLTLWLEAIKERP